MLRPICWAACLLLTLSASLGQAQDPVLDPKKADADFAFQGEYVGTLTRDGQDMKLGVQVIALGGGKFHAVGHHGGLPGDGWNGEEKREADGELKDGSVIFKVGEASAEIKNGALTIKDGGGNALLRVLHHARDLHLLTHVVGEGIADVGLAIAAGVMLFRDDKVEFFRRGQ